MEGGHCRDYTLYLDETSTLFQNGGKLRNKHRRRSRQPMGRLHYHHPYRRPRGVGAGVPSWSQSRQGIATTFSRLPWVDGVWGLENVLCGTIELERLGQFPSPVVKIDSIPCPDSDTHDIHYIVNFRFTDIVIKGTQNDDTVTTVRVRAIYAAAARG